MKTLCTTIIYLITVFYSIAQNKIEFAVSSFKKINTFSYFSTNPASPLSVVPNKTTDEKGLSTLYFDKSNQKTSVDKAYYYRKIRFGQNQFPIGVVEDHYKSNNKLKFSGSYFYYKPEDENANNLYQGECLFFSEDGMKSIRKYKDGQLLDEKVYYPNNKLKIEQIFNPNKTRKYFKEITYFANGVEKEVIIGAFNVVLKAEIYSKKIYNEKGQTIMSLDYENSCPKPIAQYYKDEMTSYNVYLQDFSCQVNTKDWAWRGNQYFTTSYSDIEKKYQVVSTDVGNGFLTIPLNGEFKTKPFEMVAEYEKPSKDHIKEFGIVWQYQNEQNFSYFLINTEKNTFEINTKTNGEMGKSMIGIKPQIVLKDENGKFIIKLSADPVNNKYEYSVNGQAIQGFNKFPLNQSADLKNLVFGFFYKSAKPNENIILKKLECKLF
jgi:hypothetical protein